ncbi:hypothetical protein [Mucilaginibacter pedocola]|uniref:hypothetical protein n=1 Tax=Mucilaginibacter pedocola TaxID=1792845 RepID=UPI00117D6719|nr:hypothetical protein [Mucilaginibacter pedocola]
MDEDNFYTGRLNEPQLIILDRVKKAVAGLSVLEAKEVLSAAIHETERLAVAPYPTSHPS